MKTIRKDYQGTIPTNKILNEQTDSNTDTYSCDYINNMTFESSGGGDTLPIGAIVKFDGDVVPEGYEKVADGFIAFTYQEQVVGTWLGKPLYQKTIDFGDFPTAGQGKTVAHNAANVDKIWVDRSNSYFVDSSKGYYDVSDYDWHTHVNATNIIMYTEYSRPNSSVYITIRYTKTTD